MHVKLVTHYPVTMAFQEHNLNGTEGVRQYHQPFTCAFFLYENASRSFSPNTVWLCDFFAKGYWQKSARKMLMKLTQGEYPFFFLEKSTFQKYLKVNALDVSCRLPFYDTPH